MHTDLHKAMQKAMTKVGMPHHMGPATPFDHKPTDEPDRAALRSQLQAVRSRMEALSPECAALAMQLPNF